MCRAGQIFGAGVDFGLAIASAIISHPLSDTSAEWFAALAKTRVELREIGDYALEEARPVADEENGAYADTSLLIDYTTI